jgi:SAM-dependent methyltransferase
LNKDEIARILKLHPEWYQKIQLPFGLETPGKDRSQIAEKIFPSNLQGASVLDVGCAEGFFCFEAKKRNAGRVIGVDIDKDRLGTAIKLGKALEMDIEFQQRSVIDVEQLGMFDYVLCLNILHHVTDPIHIINKLIQITRKQLALEIADIRTRVSAIGLRRKSKELLGWWGTFLKCFPSEFQPGILVNDTWGRFLITRNWIRNLFQTRYFDIERTEILDSDLENRYLVVAFMREISSLRIISGPTDVGKSSIVTRLKAGDPALCELLDLGIQNGWQFITPSQLQEKSGNKMDKIIMEYDIFRPIFFRYGNGDFNSDPAMTINRVAANKTAYIFVCPTNTLISRVNHDLNKYKRPKRKHQLLAERVIFEYSQPGKLLNLYEAWIAYCKTNGFNIKYMDSSSSKVKEVTQQEAMILVS